MQTPLPIPNTGGGGGGAGSSASVGQTGATGVVLVRYPIPTDSLGKKEDEHVFYVKVGDGGESGANGEASMFGPLIARGGGAGGGLPDIQRPHQRSISFRKDGDVPILESPPFTGTTNAETSGTPWALSNVTARGWAVAASSVDTSSRKVWKAFNKTALDSLDMWHSDLTMPGEWLSIAFPLPVRIKSYAITSRNNSNYVWFPAEWILQGRDTSTGEWTDLEINRRTESTWDAAVRKTYAHGFQASAIYEHYREYRLYFYASRKTNTESDGSYVVIGDWTLDVESPFDGPFLDGRAGGSGGGAAASEEEARDTRGGAPTRRTGIGMGSAAHSNLSSSSDITTGVTVPIPATPAADRMGCGGGGAGGSGTLGLVRDAPVLKTKPLVAYSLRRLFGDYEGPQLRVKRAFDGVEADVYFDKTGDVTKVKEDGDNTVRSYPPAALTADTVTLTGQAYGNGTYRVTASSIHSNFIHWAFDGRIGNYFWHSVYDDSNFNYVSSTGEYQGISQTTTVDGVTLAGEWIQIELPFIERLSLTGSYDISLRDSWEKRRSLNTFRILGSNDGTDGSWVVLDSRADLYWTTVTRTFDLPSLLTNSNEITYYRFFRIVVEVVGNDDETSLRNSIQISDWTLRGLRKTTWTSSSSDIGRNLWPADVYRVRRWYDQSGYGKHATATSTLLGPLYHAPTNAIIGRQTVDDELVSPQQNDADLFTNGGGWMLSATMKFVKDHVLIGAHGNNRVYIGRRDGGLTVGVGDANFTSGNGSTLDEFQTVWSAYNHGATTAETYDGGTKVGSVSTSYDSTQTPVNLNLTTVTPENFTYAIGGDTKEFILFRYDEALPSTFPSMIA